MTESDKHILRQDLIYYDEDGAERYKCKVLTVSKIVKIKEIIDEYPDNNKNGDLASLSSIIHDELLSMDDVTIQDLQIDELI